MINEIPFEKFGFPKIQIETLKPELHLLNSLPDSGFAIVGTRYPQRKSFEFLEKTVRDLRDSGLIIVSGFARGIDSRAHELAIDSGLKTVAIIGCGLNVDYPRENRHLRKKILDHGGMILSPFEAGAPALPHHFLNRNQLIAHFSKAVWVVEAASISGSLNTANHAFQLDRDLYATPCFPDDIFYEGNQKLLSQKETEKYPIAEPFFGAHSLLKTWGTLSLPERQEKRTKRIEPSRIQKWVSELEFRQGDCNIQSLLHHALNQGLTAGGFFKEFQQNLEEKKVIEDRTGKVSLR